MQVLPGRAVVAARALWLIVAIVAAALVQSMWFQPIGWMPVVVVTGLAFATFVSPAGGLVALGGLEPLAAVLLILVRPGDFNFRFVEALVLAFIAGCAARRCWRWQPSALSAGLRWSAGLLIALALASGVVQACVMRVEQPDVTLGSFLLQLQHHYLVDINPVAAAVLFAEGVLLVLLVAEVSAHNSRTREAVLRMMVAGAAGAALLNVLRIVEVAVRQDASPATWFHLFATLRVNTQYGDWNAAGSYFAMLLFIALACRSRLLVAVAVPLLAIGIWITGSRTALVAVFLTVIGILIARHAKERADRLRVAATLVVLLAVAVSVGVLYPRGRNAASGYAIRVRVVLAKSALRMTAAHPVFGVGLGRFYGLSQQYMNPAEDPGYSENAHDNFLQILAELGIPGLLLFLIVLWLAFREARGRPEDWGVIGGLVAFLLTCIGGHPLLVPEVAYPFWIVVGVAAASDRPRRSDRAVASTGWILIAAIGVALAFRVPAAVAQADMESASWGLSQWQHGPDGAYRWAAGRAMFYVPAAARGVRIPLHRGPKAPDPLEIHIFVDGHEANVFELSGIDGWRTVTLQLRPAGHSLYERIDLMTQTPGSAQPLAAPASDTAGVLMVGKPTILK